MVSILLIMQFVLAVIITIVVLLQKSSSIGLGVYSGSNESWFGAKGPASFLAKATFVISILFVANTLALGYVYSKDAGRSVLDTIDSSSLVPAAIPTFEQNQSQKQSIDSLVPQNPQGEKNATK
ncbi:MAG: preprotein translocase subunit SecG [Helicobacter sp.]|nr:preprotein translocase subunit SecG [Helicobacter sp.]